MATENQREIGHDANIKHIISTFKQAEVDLETFEARAVNAGSEHIFGEIKDSLKAVQEYLHKAMNPPKDKDGNQAKPLPLSQVVKFTHEFLKSLASLSPHFQEQMRQANLLDVDHKQILANAKLRNNLQELMNYALRADTLRQVHIDLEKTLREYYAAADLEAKKQAKKLRETIGQHHKTARNEFADLGETSTANKRSNSMFDPVKVIGHLLSSIYYLQVLAPLKNKLFPNAKFDHKYLDPSKDPQRVLNNQRYGGTLAPAGAAAPADAPRPSGPGK